MRLILVSDLRMLETTNKTLALLGDAASARQLLVLDTRSCLSDAHPASKCSSIMPKSPTKFCSRYSEWQLTLTHETYSCGPAPVPRDVSVLSNLLGLQVRLHVDRNGFGACQRSIRNRLIHSQTCRYNPWDLSRSIKEQGKMPSYQNNCSVLYIPSVELFLLGLSYSDAGRTFRQRGEAIDSLSYDIHVLEGGKLSKPQHPSRTEGTPKKLTEGMAASELCGRLLK
ncbi:hypothetical protein SISSUDRAFT_181673 [Sistotremastrum suecicum HHB10207 ss-3]|uniref:Uncharacterized protein n=1 Tax=Sistotremastrum suecicum HHB10207 ss-3 TaxID=1314776 RepID=A0A166GSQ6_9AGAM|nr:hypothetical protein SISSUDRAFT_181673 [Sistotremastrum suecicum HHB10207 ss-3]